MRYAIFSDIHGNLPAWNAVLNDMKSLEADVFVCLGDIVGYGPKPQEVLDGIRSVTSNFVIGNHDAAAAGILDDSIFNDQAREAIAWTRNQLNEETIKFFRKMPLVIEDQDVVFVHAGMSEPGRYLYLNSAAEARASFQATQRKITFVGHSHTPCMFVETPHGAIQRLPDSDGILKGDSRYIINVGSVGEPRSSTDIRACYVIYDKDTHTVTFRKIGFDVETYRTELQASGLKVTPYFLQVADQNPEVLAQSQIAETEPAMATKLQTNSIQPVAVPDARKQVVLLSPGTQTSQPQPKVAMALPKDRSPAVAIISIVVLLIAMIGILIWYNGKSPESGELVSKDIDSKPPDSGRQPEPLAEVADPGPPNSDKQPKPDPSPSPLQPSPAIEPGTTSPDDYILFDFEGDNFDDWVVEGAAFGSKPAGVRITARKGFSGQAGKTVAHSSHGGDGPTGKLTSPAFKVTHRYLRFLIAGGPHEGQTYVGLKIDGKLVHSATGGERLEFREVLWDLSSFADKEAELVAVDESHSSWGVIAFDQVVLTDDKGKLTPQPPLP